MSTFGANGLSSVLWRARRSWRISDWLEKSTFESLHFDKHLTKWFVKTTSFKFFLIWTNSTIDFSTSRKFFNICQRANESRTAPEGIPKLVASDLFSTFAKRQLLILKSSFESRMLDFILNFWFLNFWFKAQILKSECVLRHCIKKIVLVPWKNCPKILSAHIYYILSR